MKKRIDVRLAKIAILLLINILQLTLANNYDKYINIPKLFIYEMKNDKYFKEQPLLTKYTNMSPVINKGSKPLIDLTDYKIKRYLRNDNNILHLHTNSTIRLDFTNVQVVDVNAKIGSKPITVRREEGLYFIGLDVDEGIFTIEVEADIPYLRFTYILRVKTQGESL